MFHDYKTKFISGANNNINKIPEYIFNTDESWYIYHNGDDHDILNNTIQLVSHCYEAQTKREDFLEKK